jgi:hypothetical protein
MIKEFLNKIAKYFPHHHKWEFKRYPNDDQSFGTVYRCECGEHLFVTPRGAKKLLGK